MASNPAIPLTGHRERQHDASLNILTPAGEYNQTYTEDEMPPRRVREDDEDRLDRVERILETVAGGVISERRRATWFMVAVGAVTILGSTGNFIGNSGIWVGNKNKELETLQKQQEKIDNEVIYLRTWNEKLRNNMAAHGWLIDADANVTRIEERKRR